MSNIYSACAMSKEYQSYRSVFLHFTRLDNYGLLVKLDDIKQFLAQNQKISLGAHCSRTNWNVNSLIYSYDLCRFTHWFMQLKYYCKRVISRRCAAQVHYMPSASSSDSTSKASLGQVENRQTGRPHSTRVYCMAKAKKNEIRWVNVCNYDWRNIQLIPHFCEKRTTTLID